MAALQSTEPPKTWRIRALNRESSDVLIIAPHGGGIEPGTSELAEAIAGDTFSLYRFEGRNPGRNQELHITSHHFSEPTAIALAAKCRVVLGIHGCVGRRAIYVGGRDLQFVALLTNALVKVGLPATSTGHKYRALEPNNICNQGKRLGGAQLEITRDLRSSRGRARIAPIVRGVIADYLRGLLSATERAKVLAMARRLANR